MGLVWTESHCRVVRHTVGNFAKFFQNRGNFEILTTNFFFDQMLRFGFDTSLP